MNTQTNTSLNRKNQLLGNIESRKLIFILTLFLGLGALLSSCKGKLYGIKGEGPITSVELDVEEFHGIDLEGAFNVEIVKGDAQKVIAEGHQNIIDELQTKVRSGIWDIGFEPGMYRDYELTIYITSPEIDEMIISGAGDIRTAGFENIDALDIRISGSGNVKGLTPFQVNNKASFDIPGSGSIWMELETPKIYTDVQGSGDLFLSGSTTYQDIYISGSGLYNAFDLTSDNVEVKIDGSGDIEVNADKNLDVNIFGSGDIYYTGRPQIDTKILGSGDIYDAN